MKRVILSAVSAVFMLVGSAYAEKDINWSDLIDRTAQNFDDPFLDLSYDQMEALRTVVVSRSKLQSDGLPTAEQVMLEERVQGAQATLAADGIDADWLIGQRWVVKERREKAATAGNPAVNGEIVSLSGYAIPAPPDSDGAKLAYLVPERGMCSHMPPPDPNQMVKVRLDDDWQPTFVHQPIRITGMMSIAPSQTMFDVVDGAVQMNATFVMDVERVVTLANMKTSDSSAATIERANRMAEKLRASNAFSKMPASE